mmetsp:Transcript_81845/g.136829  ORF Transcript_81845/g.136829 Transcript_81845/m.136829 type:complete len:229 (+) Transcript_81845:438-1124(+)
MRRATHPATPGRWPGAPIARGQADGVPHDDPGRRHGCRAARRRRPAAAPGSAAGDGGVVAARQPHARGGPQHQEPPAGPQHGQSADVPRHRARGAHPKPHVALAAAEAQGPGREAGVPGGPALGAVAAAVGAPQALRVPPGRGRRGRNAAGAAATRGRGARPFPQDLRHALGAAPRAGGGQSPPDIGPDVAGQLPEFQKGCRRNAPAAEGQECAVPTGHLHCGGCRQC